MIPAVTLTPPHPSMLRLVSSFPSSTNTTVTWQSIGGVNYSLERSISLSSPFALLATKIIGQAGTTSFADTNTASLVAAFYRVGVRH